MKLVLNWNEFTQKVDAFISEAHNLLEKGKILSNEVECEKINAEIASWEDSCYKLLKGSFDSPKNEFAEGFYYSRTNKYNIPGRKRDFQQVTKERIEDVKSKSELLAYYTRLLSISDAIIKPETTNLELRSKYTTEEILELLLEKLYVLYDTSYHPVGPILEGNGIVLKRYGEERELVNHLKSIGFVNPMFTRTVSAQLTLEGKIYVENKRKVQSTNYNDINFSVEEISTKIEEVIYELKRLGLGQEILFDELQELKELYGKLNNKNWGQILKGKLLDLGLSQIINTDTIKFIYEQLTKQIFQLP